MTARTIAILLFDGVEELDAVGPWEVLAFWTQNFPDDDWRVVTASVGGEAITAAKGMVITPTTALEELERIDVLLHPGGRGTRTLYRDPEHLERIRRVAGDAELMTSVCTGSLVYAGAGLLQGRPATTHWRSLDLLHEIDPSIDVRGGQRWVDDGDVVTSAGVSAGIDMALHLVGRLVSPTRAIEVQRGIEYDPAPPRWDEDSSGPGAAERPGS
ncbi:DJ-1/PfpI family protein [Brachybacterium endophyticum]|uniref:DJ-1/PfpI family protein n=1 Tax=Brachybacterium endophyticum TaxID=2182385 RepID=A0A2U2RJL3_9MICO|nr:DJ-1/PfpI family protein [Brachybacterium endophyticum]PWH06053.1 DJ-1/PfpI family protein [Brachybacterium endophyticum]